MQVLSTGWWLLSLVIVISALIDGVYWKNEVKLIDANRTIPGSLALGVNNEIGISLQNKLNRSIEIQLTDQYPDEVDATGLPRQLVLAASEHADLIYNVLPIKRGDAHFGLVCLRVLSRLRFWQLYLTRHQPDSVKIYPNFRSISNFKTLGLHHHIGQMGIHVKQRRGQGLDFHQLREFREGDSVNQIDWKATARMRKPIAREYQDERDQDVIFLLDCGRRMHAKDGVLNHFDHVLNAFLLTSHVALRQGDAVGLMTFAGAERWISPIKGQHSINTLLNQVYDLHSSTETSDFSQAAQRLLNQHRKRSLVVLITNLHDEDTDDLKPAIQLISKQHLVIVANLREQFLDNIIQQPVHNFDTALSFAAANEFIYRRHRLLETLRKQGVFVADSLPHLLHIDLINEYLALKRRGQI
ncbi:MAG TPA: DUF58 domain-containing protein [Gammaproteobacteria bacterium]